MRIAFLTEMGFTGKVAANNTNMRTEFAWMHALDADHHNIRDYNNVLAYDHVFIIFPKGDVYLNSVAVKISNQKNSVSDLLSFNDPIPSLKSNNKKVHFVQEGPHWLWNDYEMIDQVRYYNMIVLCDSIFCHNEHDKNYYLGMFPGKEVNVIPSLMIEELTKNITPTKEDKAIIGGNFARWYGGFESYMVAKEFDLPIWGQTSHAMRDGEDQLVNRLPRMMWIDWMKSLSTFKYAVHLMPTVAAGTFSLNCAYFGIPCIGNKNVDTQVNCHPLLSVNIEDLITVRHLVKKLKDDKEFYNKCSEDAKSNYQKHYRVDTWKTNMFNTLESIKK